MFACNTVRKRTVFVRVRTGYVSRQVIKGAAVPKGCHILIFYVKPACECSRVLHFRVRDCSGYPGEALCKGFAPEYERKARPEVRGTPPKKSYWSSMQQPLVCFVSMA